MNVTRGRRDVIPQLGPEADAHQPSKGLPHAFTGSPVFLQAQSSRILPDGSRAMPEVAKLWTLFRHRIHPTVTMSFPWTVERLELAMTDAALYSELTSGERALAAASCYFGIVSMANDECVAELGTSKADMLAAYRSHCEQSLLHVNLLAIDDLDSLKALCLYVVSGILRDYIYAKS